MYFIRINRHEFRNETLTEAIGFAQRQHNGAGYTITDGNGTICIAHNPNAYTAERQMMDHVIYSERKDRLSAATLQNIYAIYDKHPMRSY